MRAAIKISSALAIGLLAGWIVTSSWQAAGPLRANHHAPTAPVEVNATASPDWQQWLDKSSPLETTESAHRFWQKMVGGQNQPASRLQFLRDQAYAMMPPETFISILSDQRFLDLNPVKLESFRTDGRSQWKPSWWLLLWECGPAEAIQASGTLPCPFFNNKLEHWLSDSLASADPELGFSWILTLQDPFNPLADYLGKVASHDVVKAGDLWAKLPSDGETMCAKQKASIARRLTASALMSEWARTDWKAALAWGAKNLPREDAHQAVESMLRFLGEAKHQEIVESAASIEDPAIRSLAYSHALSDLKATAESLLDKALALPANALDQEGWAMLGQRSAGMVPRKEDPVMGAARLRALASQVPEEFRQGFLVQAANMASWNNKPLGAQLLEYLPEGNAGIMAGEWVEQDPVAASTWLASLPPSAKRDAAVIGFCRALSPLDPESAADWALTVQDAARRDAAVKDALGAWKLKDPSAAQAWAEEKKLQ